MDFHTLFPDTIVFIVPVLECDQIINYLLYHFTFFICLNHTHSPELKLNDEIQYFPHCVVLAVPPLFPILFKGLWVETGVDILPGFMWLVFNRPVDFVFVFYKKSEEGLGRFLYYRQITRFKKPQGHKINIPEPGLIVASLYIVGRGSEHTSRFLECTQDIEMSLDFYIKIK